ncbi:putative integral membrane protein [Brugia pahangi]
MITYELQFLIFLLIFIVTSLTLIIKNDGCRLKWNATYHMNGRRALLQLNETWMDTLGYCIVSSSNRYNYIFRLELNDDICYRCVAIFNVHPNILQYKQSECIKQYESSSDNIDNICRFAFRGDTPMKTLFRYDARSEQCPFEPPFNFTYTIQDGSCTSRISSVNICSEHGKYRFRYEACPELPNHESHEDELECIAHWNSFGIEFFAVRIINSSITGSNIIFRCLIHQKTTFGGRMGISADSSCNELTDLTNAGTRIEYYQGPSFKSHCHFPTFLRRNYNSSSKHKWISMTTGSINDFYSDKWIEMINGMNYTISQCLQMENIGNVYKMVVYKSTQQCTNTYQCIEMKRRHKNIIEITYDKVMRNMPVSCKFINEYSIDTMALVDAKTVRCPFNRQHFIQSCTNSVAQFGCTYDYELIMHLNCSNTSFEKFFCIGHWQENGMQYIVSRRSISSELLCHIYSSNANGIIRIVTYRHSSCHAESLQQSQPYHNFTLTKYDSCLPLNGVSMKNEIDSSLAAIFILLSFAVNLCILILSVIYRCFQQS